MVKKHFFSITLIILFLSLPGSIPGLLAYANTQAQVETATPTPMGIDSILQTTTFGNAEVGSLFSTGDGEKLIFSFEDNLEIFDGESYDFIEKFKLNDDYDNSILDASDQGKLIAIRANTGFYIYDTENKMQSALFESGADGYSFYAFPPIGKAFLYGVHHTSSLGRTTELLLRGVDDKNGILLIDYLKPADTQPYFEYISPVASPDGKYVAAGFSDKVSNRILVWETKAQEVFYEIKTIPAKVNSLAIDPDSKTFASGGEDGIVRVWDMETGEFVERINGLNAPIASIQYIDEGRVLSIKTTTGKYFTYNFVSNQLIQRSATDEMNHPLILQKADEGYILERADKENPASSSASLVFSPDGSKIALIEGSVQIWDVEGNSLVASFLPDIRFGITNTSFDPAGERLVILTNQGDLYVWNIESKSTELHLPAQRMLEKQEPYTIENVSNAGNYDLTDFSNNNIVFSPDGKQIAFANGMNVEIWNVALKARMKSLAAESAYGRPEKVTFSEDGESITAIFDTDQYAVTWELNKGEVIDQFELTYAANTHGASTNLNAGNFVSLNNADSETWIELWNLQNQDSEALTIINDSILVSAFSTPGTIFGAIDDSSNLYIWRTDTAQLIHFEKDFSRSRTMAINPSGSILATADDGQITFWSLAPITENGLSENFVSPTLVPEEQNDGFTFNFGPTPTAMPTSTPEQSETINEPDTSDAEVTTESDDTSITDSILLKTYQNQGIIKSILWQNNKIFFSSTSGLYSYSLTKEDISIVFTNEDMAISSIEGIIAANYFAAGTKNNEQILLWNQKLSKEILDAPGFSAPVICPNKKWLAYYLGNSRLMLWNINKARSEFILPVDEPSAPMVFSPYSEYLAVALDNGLIQIWNTAKGTIERTVSSGTTPSTRIQFSKDGKSLIGIAGGSVWIWSVKTETDPVIYEVYPEKDIKSNTSPEYYLTAADINYTGKIIAIADNTGTVRFYTMEDQNLYRNMSQPKYEITHLKFSPTNNQLLTVDINGNVAIWDADSSELLSKLQFFAGKFNGLKTLDDGTIAAWTKNQITIYDAETLEIENQVAIDAEEILDVSNNGLWVIAYSSTAVNLFNASSGELLATLSSGSSDDQVFLGADFSANSEYLIINGSGGAWIYLLDQNDLSKTSLLGHIETAKVSIAALSDDGSQFILSTGEGYLRPKVYDTAKQTELAELPLAEYQTNLIGGQEYAVYAFSPDQKQAILLRSGLYTDARLEIYDLATGQVINYIRFEDTTADALAISSDGAQIAVGFDTGQIRIYSTEDLTVLETFSAHPSAVSHLVFSDDDTYLISTGAEGTIKSWIMR